MKLFGFKRKKKTADEISRLGSLLDQNPEDSESRLALAHLYVQVGDYDKAYGEYRTAARVLSAQGADLESIAIYKKILSIVGSSLPEDSLAAVRKADQLLVETKDAYERVFKMESRDGQSREPSEPYQDATGDRKDEKEEGSSTANSEPVPLEILQEPSQDQVVEEMPQDEEPEKEFMNQETSLSEPPVSDEPNDLYHPAEDQGPIESQDDAPEEGQASDSSHEAQAAREPDLFHPTESPPIDIKDIQIDDDLETLLSDHETETSTDDLLSQETARGRDTAEQVVEPSDHEDPDFHYNLGVAYYEMDLIEKAITEFVKAHNQGIKPAESLFMLAKCYCKKGLFQNAAGYIGQALGLDNLTRDQRDLLQGQLERIKTRID
jgi:tetratricopeptide (TPR) repeat protein